MSRALEISTSGLVAQRQRMNTIAGNIANLNTTRGADGEPAPFQRRFATFSVDAGRSTEETGGLGVQYEIEVDSATAPRTQYDPSHPDADADGYVSYPNINLVTEFVNAMEASRAYQANLAAIEITKELTHLSLRILA
jgi:flagellar basal-body rod protein FlgC